jgi:hypothetical protein
VEIEPHLIAEDTARSGSGTVAFFGSVVDDVAEKIKILLHAYHLRHTAPIFPAGAR